MGKQIDKNNVNDTGTEGIRLADKTLKSVGKTIKTTERTIKTGSHVVSDTVKVIRKVPAAIGSVVSHTVQYTVKIATNTIAVVTNPIFLIIAFAIMIIVILAAAVVMLIGGGASGEVNNGNAQAGAVGLDDVPGQYHTAQDYYHIACENNKTGFYNIIDSLYYNPADMPHSDVVYMEDTNPDGGKVYYPRRFPTDDDKSTLKSAWDMPVTEQQAIAIAYVLLEKRINDNEGTTRQIFEVTFTQEIFNEIINTAVMYTDMVYLNQSCPGRVCTAEFTPNPDYDVALSNRDTSVAAYNAWFEITDLIAHCREIPNGSAQQSYWDNNIAGKIDSWNQNYSEFYGKTANTDNNGQDFLHFLGEAYEGYEQTLSNTPSTNIEQRCDELHKLHSIGISSCNIDNLLIALGIDDTYKQWYELTLKGFENNPDL